MKTYNKEEIALNIISNAVKHGFEFDFSDSFKNILDEARSFITDNEIDSYEEECEVIGDGTSQYVSHSDRMGTEFVSSGEILDYSTYLQKDAEYKIFHSDYVDSLGRLCKLYQLVGETDYNKQ